MRLLFALLVVLSSAAAAADCPSDFVLPERGATVPIDAKIWVGTSGPWSYQLDDGERVVPLEPAAYVPQLDPVVELSPRLVPNKHYELRDHTGKLVTEFSTVQAYGYPPPQAPVPVTNGFAFDPRAPLVRVELTDPRHTYPYVTRTECAPPVAPAGACLRVMSIDIAGRTSRAVEQCTPDVIPVTIVSAAVAPRDGGAHAMLAIGFVVAMLIGFFLVFAPEIDMGWLRRRIYGEPLLPAAARQLAQSVARAALLRGAAVAIGCAVTGAVAGAPAAWFAMLATALLGVRQLWLFVRARRMLALLDDNAVVTLHGDHVLRVCSADRTSWLVVSQRQLAHATERVLPLARVLR